jgi:hypothetical protein
MRLHTIDAEKKCIYKYEYGEWLQCFNGIFEKDKEEEKTD